MEKMRESVLAPVEVGPATVIPVVRSFHHCRIDSDGVVCSGAIVPVTVVVVLDGRKRAFKMTGEEVSADGLVAVPGGDDRRSPCETE
jgi:hypothetical protein